MSTDGNDGREPEQAAAGDDHEVIGFGVDSDGTDHHGQDDGRDTLTAGQAQRENGSGGVQDQPAMSQNNASDDEKITGIIAQTRQDVGDQDDARIAEVLRQRFDQSGIHVADEDLAGLAARVRSGD